MNKKLLLEKINHKNYDYNKGQLNSWVCSLPASTNITPAKLKRGDVFMHPVFSHPYVLLEKSNGYWVCTLMTSNGEFEEVLEQCNSRFFHASHFVKALFTVTDPIGAFVGVYDNNRHLTDVLKKLRTILVV